jgi:hypothetical protein
MKHKEYGSYFYYPIDSRWYLNDSEDSFFSSPDTSLFFSGRSALYHLLSHGIASLGWTDVYLPSYYCHEVYRFLEHLDIGVHYYNFNPLHDTIIDKDDIPDRPDCVLVNVFFFGMGPADTGDFDQSVIIDDISHNLVAYKKSNAHYCFASLRKELPVPVGGFCYSPKGHSLPKGKQNSEALILAERKMEAMDLKYQYLKGAHEDKSGYRNIFAIADVKFEETYTQAVMPEMVVKILLKLDIEALSLQKQKNLNQALNILRDVKPLTLFGNPNNSPTFGLVLNCETQEKRDALKKHLVHNNIFPAVLWPDQKEGRDKMLENNILFIHADFRHDAQDITFIAHTIKTFYSDD